MDDAFKSNVSKLNKETTVLVYCAAGGRSKEAAMLLKSMGFSRIYDLDGGFTLWKEAGLKTVQ